ncbi:MAG: hypothetical protein KA902_02050 [Arenimonas sp.]|nr:hypothetical protein [Arenimonas sp.]
MEFLAGLVVAKPLNILVVALIFFAAAFAIRLHAKNRGKSTRPLLFAGTAWALYAAWEWLVLIKTPEADMRVDLLLIWPIVGALSLWAIYKLFR